MSMPHNVRPLDISCRRVKLQQVYQGHSVPRAGEMLSQRRRIRVVGQRKQTIPAALYASSAPTLSLRDRPARVLTSILNQWFVRVESVRLLYRQNERSWSCMEFYEVREEFTLVRQRKCSEPFPWSKKFREKLDVHLWIEYRPYT